MVSSPFGGVSGYRYELIQDVWNRLGFVVGGGTKVLEVGCGRAWLRGYLQDKGSSYIGLDLVIPDTSVGGEVPDIHGNACPLPFSDACFDRLICIDAYEHFPDPDHAVREFFRVLSPGGQMFLSTPNYGNVAGIVKWWMEQFGGCEKDTWAPFGGWVRQAHERPVTIRNVRRTFQTAGFSSGKLVGFEGEIHLGLLPWAALPGFPESLLYRLQNISNRHGHWLSEHFPTLSLHQFWCWRK